MLTNPLISENWKHLKIVSKVLCSIDMANDRKFKQESKRSIIP